MAYQKHEKSASLLYQIKLHVTSQQWTLFVAPETEERLKFPREAAQEYSFH